MKIQLTPQPATGAIDPVCGMTVDPNQAAGEYAWQGTTYYFCNPGCLAKFKADPEKYLSKAPQAAGHGPQTADGGAPAAASCCSHGAQAPAPAG
jgi:Cu+-exporting ATPase